MLLVQRTEIRHCFQKKDQKQQSSKTYNLINNNLN